ncbi:probable WRKY transcription factor 20 isoform X1 [Primulina eburnea]|uniref:probable WRKY transcription factor 20 isoform X1 n=1 Tax=Primulina eburnea TaxID=1245227 RepID=UPI003C6C2619
MEDFQSLSQSPSDNASAHVPDGCSSAASDAAVQSGGGCGSSNGAKYRLMSPAKLPISRSTCITIPPGLSPTSFLESPVLLSYVKVEPSPTTGSLFKPQLMQRACENSVLSSEKIYSRGNTIDGITSGDFEFKFLAGSNTASELPSTGQAIPVGFNVNGPFGQAQDQRFSQSSAPSNLATYGLSELRVAAPMSVHETSACSTADELNHGRQLTTTVISDPKDSSPSATADRTSDDGYNWRKYGQKLVKGSEFPRSYYKCTYPNCEVKKIFERSPSGQITEIVYKGSHDHPKPQAARRQNSGALISIQEEKLDQSLSFMVQEDKLHISNLEPNVSLVLSPRKANEDGLDGSGSQFLAINEEVDEDDPVLKRRRMEDGLDVTPVVKAIREPRVVVQTISEVDILDDGYRWRKYGQKVVRGNPNPRSYYKCTNAGCPVRKHVERASNDPKAVITTYEGKHNHDVPTARNNSHEFAGNTPYTITSKIRPEGSNSLSLDLGVGISRVAENRLNEHAHTSNAEDRDQIAQHDSGMKVVQQSPACYGIVNGGLNLYENREKKVEVHTFQTLPIHPSNQCQQNPGRILMGP